MTYTGLKETCLKVRVQVHVQPQFCKHRVTTDDLGLIKLAETFLYFYLFHN